MDERAQTFTLEAFVAAIILVGALAFALQAVAISANTASGGDLEWRTQQATVTEDVLAQAAADGSLVDTVVAWNESDARFHGASHEDGHYVTSLPADAPAGPAFAAIVGESTTRYSVDLRYPDGTGGWAVQPLVDAGTPSTNAVRVTETVTIFENTSMIDADGEPRATNVSAIDEPFYAPNVDDERAVYTVIRVEVTVWRH